jgi:hypothetical protein
MSVCVCMSVCVSVCVCVHVSMCVSRGPPLHRISWLEVRVIKDFAALHGANNPSSSTPFLTQAPGYS